MYCWIMIGWLKRVITGWWNVITKNESEEAKRRLAICIECKDKVKIGKNKWICSHCGCFIHAKCASPDEKCLMDKW